MEEKSTETRASKWLLSSRGLKLDSDEQLFVLDGTNLSTGYGNTLHSPHLPASCPFFVILYKKTPLIFLAVAGSASIRVLISLNISSHLRSSAATLCRLMAGRTSFKSMYAPNDENFALPTRHLRQ